MRDGLGNADAHAGIGAIGDARFDVGGVECQFLVEDGIRVTLQRLPVGYGLVPVVTLGSILPTLEILEGHVVGGNESATCAHLDGEVAERQAALHAEVTHHLAGIFDEVARGPAGGDLGHQVEGHILGRHTTLELSVDGDTHGLRLLLQDAL